jgi:hypothetical protein
MNLLTIEIEDKFSWGLEKVTEQIESTLEDEANLRGWGPDYRLDKNPTVQALDSGVIRYSFRVEGRYLDSETETWSERQGASGGQSGPNFAAKDSEA